MKILVDCRCLNYPFFTGVNSYAIRLLHCLFLLKSKKPDLKIDSVGIKPDRLLQLQDEFEFFSQLFDRNIGLEEYCRSGIKLGNKYLEANFVIKNKLGFGLDNNKLEFFDYVILPQPRLLPLHPDAKLVTIFHDIFSILDKENQWPQNLVFNKQTCQIIVNRSHRVIAGSISTCRDVNKVFYGLDGFDNPKIKLIYPALPKINDLQKQTQVTSCQPIKKGYIIAISGIEPRKNWENLILAHHHLQQNQDWKVILVLAGSIVDNKYYQKLIKLIQTLDIQNIVWKLNPSESQKFNLIQNSLFLCYPSMYEGFGFPILEAFDHNKTVVTSRISSMPEIGKNSCVYVNPFSYVSIANGIWLVYSDLDYRKSLEGNIAKVKSQYSWSEMETTLGKLLV
jgi:glycosyltransferase involved in cell wall biosynthesis